MEAAGILLLAVAAICNLHALVALVVASLRRTALAARQQARRTMALALGFVALAALLFVSSVVTHWVPGEMSEADRMRHVSNVIAEAFFQALFVLVGILVPLASSAWLFWRARRLERNRPGG